MFYSVDVAKDSTCAIFWQPVDVFRSTNINVQIHLEKNVNKQYVYISKKRMNELEYLEKNVSSIIQKAVIANEKGDVK